MDELTEGPLPCYTHVAEVLWHRHAFGLSRIPAHTSCPLVATHSTDCVPPVATHSTDFTYTNRRESGRRGWGRYKGSRQGEGLGLGTSDSNPGVAVGCGVCHLVEGLHLHRPPCPPCPPCPYLHHCLLGAIIAPWPHTLGMPVTSTAKARIQACPTWHPNLPHAHQNQPPAGRKDSFDYNNGGIPHSAPCPWPHAALSKMTLPSLLPLPRPCPRLCPSPGGYLSHGSFLPGHHKHDVDRHEDHHRGTCIHGAM